MPTGELELRFHHVGVCVERLDDAIAWYDRVLGFKLERKGRLEAAKADVAIVRRGSLRFELFQVEGAKPLPAERRIPNLDLQTIGNKHVAFNVEDLGRTLDELRDAGADIAFEYEGRVFFVRDNSGNLIEFVGPDIDQPMA